MFCDQCGVQVPDHARFCPSCGKAFGGVAAVPAPAAQGRVARHVRVVAILWFILSGFRLLSAITLMGIGRAGIYIPGMPFFVHQMLSGIGFVFLIGAALGLAAGWGLLQREAWARMLAIVIGALNCFDPPFGTALGIYTLWVLLPPESEREYRQLARVI
ncbi:MAG TPA: zinc ribbon domain-containing protein [Bryobacteraceae bacterium]|nr:zinc ribbon domain-containing protein [Bryobacteraceae bacterium]